MNELDKLAWKTIQIEVAGILVDFNLKSKPPEEYSDAFSELIIPYSFKCRLRWLLWSYFFNLFETSPTWMCYPNDTLNKLSESWYEYMEKSDES